MANSESIKQIKQLTATSVNIIQKSKRPIRPTTYTALPTNSKEIDSALNGNQRNILNIPVVSHESQLCQENSSSGIPSQSLSIGASFLSKSYANTMSSKLKTVQQESNILVASLPPLQDMEDFLTASSNYCNEKNSSVIGVQFHGNEPSLLSGIMPITIVEDLIDPELMEEYQPNVIPISSTTVATSAFLDEQNSSKNTFEKNTTKKENLEQFDADINFEMIILPKNMENNTTHINNDSGIFDSSNSFLDESPNNQKDIHHTTILYQQEKEDDQIFPNYIEILSNGNYRQVKEEFEQLTPSTIDFDQINVSENAIDISVCFENDNNSISLSQVLSNSDRNPMFNQFAQKKLTDNCHEELLPLIYDDFYNDKFSAYECDDPPVSNLKESVFISSQSLLQSYEETDEHINHNNLLKKHSCDEGKRKRRLMHLNTKNANKASDLDTPKIIDYILDFDKYDETSDTINSRHSLDEFKSNVLDGSLCSFTTSHDDEFSKHSLFNYKGMSPHSPENRWMPTLDHNQDYLSCVSANIVSNTLCTSSRSSSSIINTSSEHPSSSPSTKNNRNNYKRKRGRPSKEHSDRPDPIELENLTESERKRREDRYKNNEASRISRQKNKQRQEELIHAEEKLEERNGKLQKKVYELELMQNKIKKFLFNEIRWPQQKRI